MTFSLSCFFSVNSLESELEMESLLLLMENVLFALILLFLKTSRNDFFFNIFSLPPQRDERSKITFILN